MSTTIATDLERRVEDAAAHLYVWALKDIPQDLRDALADAAGRETSVPGQRVLEHDPQERPGGRRREATSSARTPASPSTTAASASTSRSTRRGSTQALYDGTERATVEHPLRSNTVHTLTRENTGPNIGHRVPIVHWDFVPDWDGLDVKCVPKGSGSENMSFLKMCVPADGVEGIKQFVLESIVGAGGKPCPPGIVGVGIGGSADYAMYLAKEAIARPVGTRNADPLVAELEEELIGLLNETGIGPMGLGGDVTVLNCHIEHADTHMTLNPVAVNYQCWAARRATAHIAPTAPSTSTGRRNRAGTVDARRILAPPALRCQALWARRQGQVRRLMATHEVTFPIRTSRDPEAPRRGRGRRPGPHHRHPRPDADPDLRPGRRAADGPPGAFLLHTAPGVRKIGPTGKYEKLCIGTTTSARMVRFTEPLGAQYGVRAICGKGGFPDEAIEPMRKHGMVYFAIVGGAAALETTQIEEIEEVAWEELMPECLWKFRVKDFGPLTVGIDAHGNSLYHDVQAAAQEKLKELYARL